MNTAEDLIAHITSAAEWQAARAAGSYTAASLETQGFIHCSNFSTEQLLAVADFLYAGQGGLLVLLIDPERLTTEVRYEGAEPGGQRFPHVYGPVNLEAVTRVVPFPPEPDGTFRLPSLEG